MTGPSFYYRHRIRIFACFLIATPFVVYGAQLAVKDNSNRVEDWLPDSFEETKRLKWFADNFTSDAIMMISWEGCTLGDSRMNQFAEELRKPVRSIDGREVYLWSQVATGDDALHQLRQPPLAMSVDDARERLHGWLLGTDNATSGIVVTMSLDAWEERHRVAEHIHTAAARVADLDESSLRIAGGVLDSIEIDNASNRGLIPLGIGSFLICFALMYALFRSFLLATMVFLNALFCHQMSLAIVYYSGTQMDSVLLMVPIVVFVLAISAGVHIANYYRDEICHRGFAGAPMRAIRDAIAPCSLASITTALGLGSLLVSFLVPVRKFGTFAAISVLLATVVLFVLLPTQLEAFPPRRAALRWRPEESDESPFWQGVLAGVIRARFIVIILTIALAALAYDGVTQLRASARIHDMFRPDARLLQDYDWLEQRLGPLVPFEIILRLPKDENGETTPSMLLQMQLIDRVHHAAASIEGIGAVVSAWNFCRPLEKERIYGRGAQQIARRTVFNKNLEQNRDSYVDLALLRDTPDEVLWRVSGRAYAGRRLDYTEVMRQLKAEIDPILEIADEQGFPGVSALYCGGIPLVQKAQDQMLSDLISSFLVAFAFIAGMMVILMLGLAYPELQASNEIGTTALIVTRSIFAGALSMVPNILPCIAVLGCMGISGMTIEIGSMMTASVALGIAVDDTLHFITWFRRGLGEGRSRREAVGLGYQRCGAAMVQTSLICGLGMLVFALSDFVPISRFAWVMFAMLMAALLADLIVLPAILLSPLGITFEPIELNSPSPIQRKPQEAV
ncbi:MAG: MMPL family transporter [Planctomycetaceae bacterium]|nr:MMPL family transporter [Planctomycetales bacterium]MCB9925039.1 MMPL family transporter [Planctomycetaceae bacterium]